MKAVIYIICLLPTIVFSQELIKITLLPSAINTQGSEFNFIRISKSKALYTSVRLNDMNYEAAIYQSEFQNGKWNEGVFYDLFESANLGNVSAHKLSEDFYFTICDKNKKCKIAEKTPTLQSPKILNKQINHEYSNNTQPHKTSHEKQNVLYFVSDRPGGFGGMDIWLSIIDQYGNFGEPINAGEMINTPADEITPFYNKQEQALYFSSNQKKGIGGFDIYKTFGKLNLWSKPKNMQDFNTEKDETYLSFYSDKEGYFASNRPSVNCATNEFCCSDIFSFQYQKKEKDFNEKIRTYLPLILYFHNDQPSYSDSDTMTNQNYQENYVSYFKMQDTYLEMNNNHDEVFKFFEEELKKNFVNLEKTLILISEELIKGKRIELKVKGFASPLFTERYNNNLSKRRIASFLNYLYEFKNGSLRQFFKNKQLTILQAPFGESAAPFNVSSDPKNQKKSIYSINAMLERKIEIIQIKAQK